MDDAHEDEPLCRSYARRFAAAKRDLEVGQGKQRAERVRKLCRLVIHISGSYMCNLDLEASCAREARARRRLRFPWIPWALFAWYWSSAVFICVYAYYQYRYDIDLLRLGALERLDSRRLVNPIPVNRTHIAKRMAQNGRTLDLLGSSLAHLTILVEAQCVMLVAMFALLGLPTLVHYRFVRPIDQFQMVRELLDRRRDTDTLRRAIERQVAQFVASGREFYQNTLPYFHAPTSLGRALQPERDSCELVREMLASGALTPLFKLQPWTQRRFEILLTFHLQLIGFVALTYVIVVATYFRHARGTSTNLHLLAACFGTSVFTSATVLIYAPLGVVAILEQIVYVAELRRMIGRCLELSEELAALHVADQLGPGAGSGQQQQQVVARVTSDRRGQLAKTLNSNLLFVLLHYKLFVAQLRPLTRSLGVLNNIWLGQMVLWPFLSRLNQPYLARLKIDWFSSGGIKIFSILVSVIVLGEVFVISVPLGHLFARCQDLYRDLSSLAARLSGVKFALPEGATSASSPVYDAHVESCLLLEIADSQRFLEPLKVRAWGITGTYSTLVRALFWYGIGIISILAEDSCGPGAESPPNVLIAFMNDPLGVYSHIKCI